MQPEILSRQIGESRLATRQLTMRSLILTFAALLTGCDPQLPSKVTAQADELASIKQRMTTLEGSVSMLEQTLQKQQQSAGNWTLWQVTEAINAGYPQALSAYSSKPECLSAASGWTFPGSKVVAEDPVIFQLKGYRVRLECLPVGTTPYAH
jgi:hypothetical protein